LRRLEIVQKRAVDYFEARSGRGAAMPRARYAIAAPHPLAQRLIFAQKANPESKNSGAITKQPARFHARQLVPLLSSGLYRRRRLLTELLLNAPRCLFAAQIIKLAGWSIGQQCCHIA
jgi:hypothetical protein